MDEKIELIKGMAIKVRKAIEKADLASVTISFEHFPLGSCGDAAPIVAQYLLDNNIEPLEYVCGVRNGHSHAWAEHDGIIIDITADQFPEVTDSVIVSRNSKWHKQFEEDDRHAGGIHVYDDYTKNVLGRAYKRVLAVIE